MLPPDARVIAEPDLVLDVIDGLLLAGGADVDPSFYGEERAPQTVNTVPERDDFEIALARRAIERDIPFLGVCRGMQVMNVAQGGTLIQDLPTVLGHEHHRRVPGSFDGADHPVHLAAGSEAAHATGAEHTGDALAPPSGHRPARRGPRRQRLVGPRRAPRGDRGAGPPLRAGRPVAPGGRRHQSRDRRARRGGAGVRTRAGSLSRSGSASRQVPSGRGGRRARRRGRTADDPPAAARRACAPRRSSRARRSLQSPRRLLWPRVRSRAAIVCALQMYAYVYAYKIPNDDEEALAARVHFDYPIRADRLIGTRRAAERAPAAGVSPATATSTATRRCSSGRTGCGSQRRTRRSPTCTATIVRASRARRCSPTRYSTLGVDRLLAGADRPAVVRRPAGPPRRRATGRAPADGRVRRGLLAAAAGSSLYSASRRQPARGDAVAALRDLDDGRRCCWRRATRARAPSAAPTPRCSASRSSTSASTTWSTCSRGLALTLAVRRPSGAATPPCAGSAALIDRLARFAHELPGRSPAPDRGGCAWSRAPDGASAGDRARQGLCVR